jgi:hypothetical protein
MHTLSSVFYRKQAQLGGDLSSAHFIAPLAETALIDIMITLNASILATKGSYFPNKTACKYN